MVLTWSLTYGLSEDSPGILSIRTLSGFACPDIEDACECVKGMYPTHGDMAVAM